MPPYRNHSFNLSQISILLVVSLPFDLLFFDFSGDIFNADFSYRSIILLVCAFILSCSSIQSSLLSALVKLQRLTLLSQDSRIALIAGALLLFFALVEASSFLANQNIPSILLSLWILTAAILTTHKQLKNRSTSLKKVSERKALLEQRTIQQDYVLRCLPVFLLRVASFSLLFDAAHFGAHIATPALTIFCCAALILLYSANEADDSSQCPLCGQRSRRSLILLSRCQSCEQSREHTALAKAGPQAKITSSSMNRTLVTGIGEVDVLADVVGALRHKQVQGTMGVKALFQRHSPRFSHALVRGYCLIVARAQSKSGMASDARQNARSLSPNQSIPHRL